MSYSPFTNEIDSLIENGRYNLAIKKFESTVNTEAFKSMVSMNQIIFYHNYFRAYQRSGQIKNFDKILLEMENKYSYLRVKKDVSYGWIKVIESD